MCYIVRPRVDTIIVCCKLCMQCRFKYYIACDIVCNATMLYFLNDYDCSHCNSSKAAGSSGSSTTVVSPLSLFTLPRVACLRTAEACTGGTALRVSSQDDASPNWQDHSGRRQQHPAVTFVRPVHRARSSRVRRSRRIGLPAGLRAREAEKR